MSITLGEKLRQAREDRGLSIAEVAEQTRISGLYLECIEKNDYRTLPGGIFNKGFVKSYAKFVGISEQEALTDYSRILSAESISEEVELKLYKPEVLTSDRSSLGNWPTMIGAVVILGLMTVGVLYFVDYLQNRTSSPVATGTNSNSNSSTNSGSETADGGSPTPSADVPDLSTAKVEVAVEGQPVRISATKDGVKSDSVAAAGSTTLFEPQESLTLNYNRWNATAVKMTINGKPIALPAEPLRGAADKGRIEFTINKNNFAQIWSTGAISTEVPAVSSDANVATDTVETPATSAPVSTAPARTPVPKPTVAANTATTPKPEPSKPTSTPKPATTPKPAATTARPPVNANR